MYMRMCRCASPPSMWTCSCLSVQVQCFPSTYVDVRDVATAHVNALERLPDLHGERFVLTGKLPIAHVHVHVHAHVPDPHGERFLLTDKVHMHS